jgi:membrane glycosyltransferase
MASNAYNDETLISDRRWSFFILNAFLWGLGGVLMAARISANGWTIAAVGLFVLFLLLQAPIAYGFTLAVTGWWILRHGGDDLRINQTVPPDAVPEELPATAIVMPIFNEDVGRVFQGLRVMFESLQATGRGDTFDFFILSDSADLNIWIAEERAWFEFCKQVGGFGRIFYRKRRLTLHHKSGNIADFCRRWGTKYKYMIVLDADSIMTGKLFVRLAALMEANPQAGIIQTSTRPVLGQTLFQRINQFASLAYGPLFVAGANFWQLGNASFYGHNAIIRVQPFMEYCAMPELPPSVRLGTRIMSHDTVEAALIRKAGYEVWSDYDLEGSYEEGPPHLLTSLQRDRRWCHGNMQHIWFLFSRGLTMPSRINILIGIMAYASSPLWLLFLIFSPVLFIGGHTQVKSALLFICAMVLLFVPKILGTLRLMSMPEQARLSGGRFKILASMLAESVYSMMLAPILMLFYTQFVWSSFFGGSSGWGRQKRADADGPSWGDCCAALLVPTLLMAAVGLAVARWIPGMLPWLSLVLIGPLLSIPFARVTSSNRLGLRAQARGWFRIPEESQPPEELKPLSEAFEPLGLQPVPAGNLEEDSGLAQTILDPRVNALHVSLLRERPQVSIHTHERLVALCDQLLRQGPSALPPREKKILFWDADSMLALHQKLWSSRTSDWHQWWQEAFRNYSNALSAKQA